VSISAGPGRSLRSAAGRRRGMSTGAGLSLIAAGAILLFAVTGGSPRWLNLHVVGVILIVVGILGLLIPRASGRGPRDRLRRWVRPGQNPGLSWGRRSTRETDIQRAAAADVAAVEEDDEAFRPDGPGRQNDDL
jgi:hypothetical protein